MSPKEQYAQRLVVVKVGGEILAFKERREQLVQNLADWKDTFFILVQGGGPQITKAVGKGEFHDGLRKTKPEDISTIHEVYWQEYQHLRQEFIDAGCGSIHVWGNHGLLRAQRANKEKLGDTGLCIGVDDDFMPDKLRVRRFLGFKLERPVIVVAPLARNQYEGPRYLNLNADEAAMWLALHFKAEALVFLTTMPHVMTPWGAPLPEIDEDIWKKHHEAIKGGMRIKVGAAMIAARGKVPKVVVADGRKGAPVERALRGEGTVVRATPRE